MWCLIYVENSFKMALRWRPNLKFIQLSRPASAIEDPRLGLCADRTSPENDLEWPNQSKSYGFWMASDSYVLGLRMCGQQVFPKEHVASFAGQITWFLCIGTLMQKLQAFVSSWRPWGNSNFPLRSCQPVSWWDHPLQWKTWLKKWPRSKYADPFEVGKLSSATQGELGCFRLGSCWIPGFKSKWWLQQWAWCKSKSLLWSLVNTC